MAKSSRASVKKRNNRQLAKRVFGPVEAARNERLSAKLMELAAQPKPERDVEMMVDGKNSKDTTTADSEEAEKATDSAEDMDVDETVAKLQSEHTSSSKKGKGKGKVEKRRHKKERNNIAFKTRKPNTRRSKDRIGRA